MRNDKDCEMNGRPGRALSLGASMKLETVRSREAYRKLCDSESSIPLFSQAWWLDAVAENTWDAGLVYRKERVVGALPFLSRRRWGLTLLTQPKLTQTLGPWLRPTGKSYPKALAHEKDVLDALIDTLPQHHYYAQNWHFSQKNWLPFYWRGFEQTTRYTYRLDLSQSLDEIWKGFQKDIRGNVNKAQNRFEVSAEETDDIRELIPVLEKTFMRQGKKFPFSKDFLIGLDERARERGQRIIILGCDSEGRAHAGTYVVWHGDTAYQLLNGYDPDYRQSGAGSLCVWEAIKKSSNHVRTYDFEGSMIEPIERFFRAFGAKQVPYFRVSRSRSRLLRAVFCLRTVVNQ
jgi:hypothetical protein